jgi:lipopolysaccharide export system protein LptA
LQKKPARCGLFLWSPFCFKRLRSLQWKIKPSKIRAFMKSPSYRPFQHATRLGGLLLVFLLASAAVWAEKTDRSKPMNIEADALRYDDQKQTSVFTGKVVLTKGTIVIRGGKLDVRQDPQGFQYGVVTAEPGKLAFFRQKRDGVDEFIEGEGEVIEYDSKADTVKFVRRAQLRRLRGATLNDEMTGAIIVYDNSTDVFTVDGGATKGTPNAPGGRIRAMLTPKPDTADVPSAAPAAPASRPSGSQTPAPSSELRPSTTLNSMPAQIPASPSSSSGGDKK